MRSVVRPDLQQLLHASFRRRTGRVLADVAGSMELYHAPAVVLMHGIQVDPLFCFANRAAQALWGYTWDEFIGMPSRLSAEPELQAAREQLLSRARIQGYIDDYVGIRIAKDGRRFHVSGVILWTIADADAVICGQAAVFRQWSHLAPAGLTDHASPEPEKLPHMGNK